MLQASLFSQCQRFGRRSPAIVAALPNSISVQISSGQPATSSSFTSPSHQQPSIGSIRCFAKKKKKETQPRVKKEFVYNPEADAEGEIKGDKTLKLVLEALNSPYKKEGPISPEERERRERIVKTFTINRFNQHNEWKHDIACKIRMKMHAVQMLPKGSKLKEEALFVEKDWWNDDPDYMRPPDFRIPGLDLSRHGDDLEDWEQFE